MASKLYALHGLRAVAATMVAVAHLLERLVKYDVIGPGWQKFVIVGGAGVYTFFAISGFIMIKTSYRNFGEADAPRHFLLRRLIRIIPIYYIFTLLFVLKMTATGEAWSLQALFLSLLFVPYMNDFGLMQPVYTLGWSLNYELYFYLVFAMCLFFRRQAGIPAIFAVIGGIVILPYLFGKVPLAEDPREIFGFYAHPVVLFFLAGMVIGLLPDTFKLSPAMCLTGAAALLIAGVASANPVYVCLASVLAVFITSLEQSPVQASPMERSAELLGEASYSIYLTHSFVLGPAVALGLKLGLLHGLAGWGYSTLTILGCVLVGVAAYIIVERPLLKYLRQKLLRPAGQYPAKA